MRFVGLFNYIQISILNLNYLIYAFVYISFEIIYEFEKKK